MHIVTISDTHLRVTKKFIVPPADVLIHAGDLLMAGGISELYSGLRWLADLPDIKHKILVAGNHDRCFEDYPALARDALSEFPTITYLQDEAITIDGVKFYGSPWQKEFCNWAFNVSEAELKMIWQNIPEDTDVLITHSPPYGIGDRSNYVIKEGDDHHQGSPSLLRRMEELRKHKLKLAVWGHLHESRGYYPIEDEKGIFHRVNAAICDDHYKPVNKPIEIELQVNLKPTDWETPFFNAEVVKGENNA